MLQCQGWLFGPEHSWIPLIRSTDCVQHSIMLQTLGFKEYEMRCMINSTEQHEHFWGLQG